MSKPQDLGQEYVADLRQQLQELGERNKKLAASLEAMLKLHGHPSGVDWLTDTALDNALTIHRTAEQLLKQNDT